MNTHQTKSEEVWRWAKSWYRKVTGKPLTPCYKTLKLQTEEQAELYRKRNVTGDLIPVHVAPCKYNNEPPTDMELRDIVTNKMRLSRAVGAFGMKTKHLREWLHGIQEEERDKKGEKQGADNDWRRFVWLIQET